MQGWISADVELRAAMPPSPKDWLGRVLKLMRCLGLGEIWHNKEVWIPLATNRGWSPSGEKEGNRILYQIFESMEFWQITAMFHSRWEWSEVGQEVGNWFLRDGSNDILKNSPNGIFHPLFISIQPPSGASPEAALATTFRLALRFEKGGELREKTHILSGMAPGRAIQSAKCPFLAFTPLAPCKPSPQSF